MNHTLQRKLEHHLCPQHQELKVNGIGGHACECFYKLSNQEGSGWIQIEMPKELYLKKVAERKKTYFGGS